MNSKVTQFKEFVHYLKMLIDITQIGKTATTSREVIIYGSAFRDYLAVTSRYGFLYVIVSTECPVDEFFSMFLDNFTHTIRDTDTISLDMNRFWGMVTEFNGTKFDDIKNSLRGIYVTVVSDATPLDVIVNGIEKYYSLDEFTWFYQGSMNTFYGSDGLIKKIKK